MKLSNEDIPTEVVADSKYSGMFRLKWADGVLSEDMYNLPRANDILRNYAQYRYDMRRPDPPWLDND